MHLWGTVVEHELGWRAQFGYPKSIVVPLEVVPTRVEEAQARLQALVAYEVDIFIEGKHRIPLSKKATGYDSAGLHAKRRASSTEG